MRRNTKALETILGHDFGDKTYFEMALSHRSAQGVNNERLEFLGDSIVNFIIAEELYTRYPKATEGELSRIRATLVKGETLAEIAQELEIGDFLRLGSGELKSGGRRRRSILADAFEAILAAIYLDSNLENCRLRILDWFADRLESLSEDSDFKDPKSQLQEYLQALKLELPEYEVISIEGEAHAQIFHVKCTTKSSKKSAVGVGASRRKAEQVAAEQLIEIFKASGL